MPFLLQPSRVQNIDTKHSIPLHSTTIPSTSDRILRIGIIGCGEISQVAHIPNINFLSHKFQKTPGDVDVILIANADAYHVEHGIIALKNDKYCLIEKPAATCFRDIDRLIGAEKVSKGNVFVGTMRCYATAFIDAVEEVGGMEKIQYARVRDISGPNSTFVEQNGTFPQTFNDFTDEAGQEGSRREADIFQQALVEEFEVPNTPQSQRMLRVVGALGSHDLPAMREILGMLKSVAGAVLTLPRGVPHFDAHIEVYSANKIVRVNFDSPYVKDLPVITTIREKIGEGGFQERTIRKTYEDPYTLEMLDLYDCVVGGGVSKTSAADARKDVELFQMILRAGADRFKF
ncbi:hypothetical protein FGADI_9180 [Fusarium gaditjirri]|uniref:Gfo/Idh/MocA-like oxidoreductase N-terminal domain-containing protein n=1 Tax=Fusarium gaditjirri TaxID=282569 RepID=A0A8H4T026_9HYPO|nr:hypothetical protein FGADI_9180 [Fusarium gaditjirri]